MVQKISRPLNDFDPVYSEATLNPWVHLATAIVVQAVRDLAGQDTIKKVDALLWLAADPLAEICCDAAGFPAKPVQLLRSANRERLEELTRKPTRAGFCLACGKALDPKRNVKALYCNGGCRQKAFRHKETIR